MEAKPCTGIISGGKANSDQSDVKDTDEGEVWACHGVCSEVLYAGCELMGSPKERPQARSKEPSTFVPTPKALDENRRLRHRRLQGSQG